MPAHRPAPSTASAPLRHPFVAAVRQALHDSRRCAVERGARVIVGLSGGPDSVALTTALATIARRSVRTGGVVPIAVHVHHHLRGRAADDDAALSESLCAALGVEHERIDVHPARERGNRSGAARRLRYEALVDAARRHGSPAILTAHHAEDQFECVLMALGRGAGLDGLAGMAPRSELAEGIILARPLLRLRKSACVAFCNDCGISWREDAGNRDEERTRVRVRRRVAPVFESLWPGAIERVAGTAELIGAVTRAIDGLLPQPELRQEGPQSEAILSRAALRAIEPALTALAVRRAALLRAPELSDRLGAEILDRVAALVHAAPSGSRVTLARGHVVTIEREVVRVIVDR